MQAVREAHKDAVCRARIFCLCIAAKCKIEKVLGAGTEIWAPDPEASLTLPNYSGALCLAQQNPLSGLKQIQRERETIPIFPPVVV